MFPDNPSWGIVRDLSWWLAADIVYLVTMFYLSLVDLFRRRYKTACRWLIAASLSIPVLLMIVWAFPD